MQFLLCENNTSSHHATCNSITMWMELRSVFKVRGLCISGVCGQNRLLCCQMFVCRYCACLQLMQIHCKQSGAIADASWPISAHVSTARLPANVFFDVVGSTTLVDTSVYCFANLRHEYPLHLPPCGVNLQGGEFVFKITLLVGCLSFQLTSSGRLSLPSTLFSVFSCCVSVQMHFRYTNSKRLV